MKAAEQPAAGHVPVVTVEAYAAAQRAEIGAWITAQQIRCGLHPDLETGMIADCCICWRNGGLDLAARLARGEYGATPLAVAERLQGEATT
jgi:hypothetical protein